MRDFVSYHSKLKESSRTQILHVNRSSNHPSTTKTRPAGEASSPANKNGRCNGAVLLV